MKSKTKIEVEGHLDKKWKDWFEGMEISYKANNTILIVKPKDQAHMFGIINRIRDLNLKLISVNPTEE
jgi:hypothetical protein